MSRFTLSSALRITRYGFLRSSSVGFGATSLYEHQSYFK